MRVFWICLLGCQSSLALSASDYPVEPVPFTAVRITDGFWKVRQEVNRTVTLPFGLQQCVDSGRVHNFDLAAEVMRRRLAGEPQFQIDPPTQYPFDDSDVYKAIEAASYVLSLEPDAHLAAEIDDWIARIAAAQEPDGYLYTFRTMHPDTPGHKWIGQKRWEKDPQSSHELYDCGHLYEAGCAHFRATGKRALLDVCRKNADLLWDTFGDGHWRIAPGHEVVELGLVKLYRTTGDARYLRLARIFLDARGPGGPVYSQNRFKVVDQTVAEGHAVRANYLYSGMADVGALTGNRAYGDAAERIWENVNAAKLYLTGGVGARAKGEAYGVDYELPNAAYNETCAAVAMMMWDHRMFLATGDAKYMDSFERTAYNGFLSGVSLSGDRFFYPNPLQYDGVARNNSGFAGRAPWFGCACCPPNLMRMLASLAGYMYAVRESSVFVNLYAQSEATVSVANSEVKLVQTTSYPWQGAVRLTVEVQHPAHFKLRLRIPTWAQGRPVSSSLYSYESAPPPWSIRVAGRVTPAKVDHGYAVIDRVWRTGDRVDLELPMPVQTVAANPAIAADRGRVAFERGPVVYCVEALVGETPPEQLLLPAEVKVAAIERPQLLGGVTALEIRGESPLPAVQAIPYYAWDNRGLVPMSVWLRTAGPAD
jgi:DUF1680 family protein